MRHIFYSLIILSFCACASKQSSSSSNRAELPPPSELSLSGDRQQLNSLRESIPDDVRRANDDLALILEMMKKPISNEMEEPGRVREKFNKVMRSRRESFDKEMRKIRDNFNKQETQKRNDFLAQLNKEREKFRSSKKTTEQNRDFFRDQDSKRQNYFAEDRDRRKDFESQMNERRRNFEDFARERTQAFNQEHRAYYKLYYEAQKSKELQKKQSSKPAADAKSTDTQGSDEFDRMPPPNSFLGTEAQ